MSTVTVTDLVPGTAATSAQANATLTSFNSASTAWGATNVRVEGVDRRTMNDAGNVVNANTSSAEFIAFTTSTPVNNTTLTPVVVGLDAGASPMITGASITAPSTARLILHARVRVYKAAIASTVLLPRVWCVLQQSTDAGVTWTTLTGSARYFQMRDTSPLCDPLLATGVPGIDQIFMWSQYVATTNVATLYRVAFETVNGDFEFLQGVITPELLLQ